MDVGTAQDWGEASGYPASGPDGRSEGIGGDGHCDAVAAGGNERSVCLGVGSGGQDEGDGQEGGQRGLADRLTGTCKIKPRVTSKKMSK